MKLPVLDSQTAEKRSSGILAWQIQIEVSGRSSDRSSSLTGFRATENKENERWGPTIERNLKITFLDIRNSLCRHLPSSDTILLPTQPTVRTSRDSQLLGCA